MCLKEILHVNFLCLSDEKARDFVLDGGEGALDPDFSWLVFMT